LTATEEKSGSAARRSPAERRKQNAAEAAERIRENYRGVKLTIQQMPYSRTFTNEQKLTALKDFGASTDAVSMSKKLFDSDEPAVKRVREVVAEINAAYTSRAYTLPHPERGTRLIKEGQYTEDDPEVVRGERRPGDPGKFMERLDKKLRDLSESLQRAAEALEAEMPEIRERERNRQVKLYDPKNYQFSAANAYKVRWQFVEVGLPNYLVQLDPALVERARQQVQAQFEQACLMKEQEEAEDLFFALDALIERLSGTREGGKVKIFRDETAGKLVGLIEESEEQLRDNGIGKGPLQRAFAKLKKIIQSEDESSLPHRLRGSEEYRSLMREGFESVANNVLNHAVLKPRRRILRQRAESDQLKQRTEG
jgi:hypothetical protein